jgi:hypothetical protein
MELDELIAPLAQVKATGSEKSGGFEAVVSVFGNVDRGGDRMIPGAFKSSLRSPDEGGRGFPPIVWSHLWGVVPVGKTMEAEEVTGFKTEKGSVVDGLYLAGEFFVDSHQTAKEVYTAMTSKGGDGLPPLRDWSFGYSAKRVVQRGDPEFEPLNKGHIRDLVEVDLLEAGPTLVGMNPAAATVGMKALRASTLQQLVAELKVGARNSAEDTKMLQQIHDLTTDLGVKCAKGLHAPATSPQLAATLFKSLGAKGYDDVDRYAIYLLTSMIEAGAGFIQGEEDPADVDRMRQLMLELAAMLADEIGEAEPDTGGDVVEMVGQMLDALPTSGEHKRAKTTDEKNRPSDADVAALIAGPLPLPAFAGASPE